MAYKYSIGSQAIGDLKATEDAQGDTQIDFGEDLIDFQTSGSSVLKISVSHVYLANGSDLHLGGNSTIFFDSDDGGSNVNVSMTERSGGNGIILDGRNRLRFRADEFIIFEAPDSSEPILVNYAANPDVLRLQMLMSSSQDISASALHLQEGIALGGQNVLDNQGNLSVSSVDAGTISGSDIVVTDENGPVYQLPIADGTSGQVIMTDGAGNLTFSSVSGGGGGGGSTSPAGSDTEIQFNNNGALGASSDLTFDGSTLGINGAIEHGNYSKTLYPSNMSNTSSYAKQKSFVKELFYTKYDWSGTSYTDLFTVEPYDERTGLPYTGSSVWAVVGIECTLTGHRRFAGNTFTKNYMVLDWGAGTTRSYNEYTGVRIGADPSVWFDAVTTSTNGLKLRFLYNNGSVGNANLHFVINAGYPIDDLSAGSDGKHIYWVLTEHFNEPSE